MKLFLAKNEGSKGDFTNDCNFEVAESSNAHSAGAVILAKTLQEAESY
jgi:hypothetical protein